MKDKYDDLIKAALALVKKWDTLGPSPEMWPEATDLTIAAEPFRQKRARVGVMFIPVIDDNEIPAIELTTDIKRLIETGIVLDASDLTLACDGLDEVVEYLQKQCKARMMEIT